MREYRNSPSRFDRAEAHSIREMIGAHEQKVVCPRCGGVLSVTGPIVGDGTMGPMFEVACEPCSRKAVITEAPGSRGPAT